MRSCRLRLCGVPAPRVATACLPGFLVVHCDHGPRPPAWRTSRWRPVLSSQGQPPRQELVKVHAERPDVAGHGERVRPELLGSRRACGTPDRHAPRGRPSPCHLCRAGAGPSCTTVEVRDRRVAAPEGRDPSDSSSPTAPSAPASRHPGPAKGPSARPRPAQVTSLTPASRAANPVAGSAVSPRRTERPGGRR